MIKTINQKNNEFRSILDQINKQYQLQTMGEAMSKPKTIKVCLYEGQSFYNYMEDILDSPTTELMVNKTELSLLKLNLKSSKSLKRDANALLICGEMFNSSTFNGRPQTMWLNKQQLALRGEEK
jgi:hypothetical protein